ncbi:sperm microtubule associated protein 1-like isoform X2 [Heterodontus francisci]|uniref:sperm microtubule associated protein 1-like isoform X2 n=1 Tax=Heterodontus francisci TaxID=7792 RepID=UPI00355BE37F
MMVSRLPPRFAPSPPIETLRRREKDFLLDCVAVSSIARDHSHSAPKAAAIIPPYNPQKDRPVLAYFRTKPLPPLLRKTGQSRDGSSVHGATVDRFEFQGAAASYLRTRNKNGAEGI